jgi:hypothetical protein
MKTRPIPTCSRTPIYRGSTGYGNTARVADVGAIWIQVQKNGAGFQTSTFGMLGLVSKIPGEFYALATAPYPHKLLWSVRALDYFLFAEATRMHQSASSASLRTHAIITSQPNRGARTLACRVETLLDASAHCSQAPARVPTRHARVRAPHRPAAKCEVIFA